MHSQSMTMVWQGVRNILLVVEQVTMTRQRQESTGQSKGRKFRKVRDELELCWKVGNSNSCEFGEEYVFYISLQLLHLI